MLSAGLGAAVVLLNPFTPGNNQGKQGDLLGHLFEHRLARPVQILVMGIDRVPSSTPGSPEALNGRTDTMLLVRFNPENQTVQLLSIPRDSRVEIPDQGFSKINDANVLGGPTLAAQVVSQNLNGIAIDRYVRVTTDAFKELVDLVGGIEVYVPEPMVYRDQTQKLDINLQPGWQTLTGDQAEQFARFRHDRYGDIGRVQRQQMLLKALRQRLQNPLVIPQLPRIIRLLSQYVDTNLSLDEIFALAGFAKDLQGDQLQMVMLPGRFSEPGEFDRSYWIINESGRDRVMGHYFGLPLPANHQSVTETEPGKWRIAIQNATGQPDVGREVAQRLANEGFRNVYVTADAPQALRQTEVIAQQGDTEAASRLQQVLGLGHIDLSSTGVIDSDLTVKVGQDWLQSRGGRSVASP